MLALIFNQAAKRRIVGLLALGEWGPATGAISGSVSTEQAGQQSIASGTVAEPVVHVVGGGGVWRGRLLPHFTLKPISGTCVTSQARQQSALTGDMVDEVEMILLALVAA